MICNICSSNKFKQFYTKDYNRGLSSDKYCYFLCEECKTLSIKSNNINLSNAYKNSFDPNKLSNKIFDKIKLKNRYFYNLFASYKIEGDLLEIGPGNGYFLSLLKEASYNVDVIEQNNILCKFYNEKIKIKKENIYCIDFNQFDTKKKYSAIFAWQVIEHLTNIDQWLSKMSKVMNKNGYLFISTPNSLSLQFKLLKSFWPHLDAPRHQNIFNYNSIKDQFKKYNFEQVKINWGIDSILWNRFGWISFFNNIFKKKNKVISIFLGNLIFLIFLPLEIIPGLSSSFITVYKKND
jgi:2-polyprenyl-3-methyl-5-hydroxy-6-metoxy-1,4-benzoquinol methylase